MTRGGRICFFSSLRNNRLAACLSRRRWTRTSSTIPVWSTARHNQCFTPAILSTTSSRCPDDLFVWQQPLSIARRDSGLYHPERHRSHRLHYGGHDPGVCGRFIGGQLLGYPEKGLA